MPEMTVVFADLTGSTAAFEALGNTRATLAITRLTQWIGRVCVAHDGKAVKYLGDGVLILFPGNTDAVEAVIELQQTHRGRLDDWPEQLRMRLQIGMARGEVVEQDGDCFGDAVNLASRLSDLSGAEQILASEAVIKDLSAHSGVRYRCLGSMDIRGRSEGCVVYRLEWQSDLTSEFFTMPAPLSMTTALTRTRGPAAVPGIALSWLGTQKSFSPDTSPFVMGRDEEAQFVVMDRRVSRQHARIVWRAGSFHLEDISSFGTWVRFADGQTVLPLRRQECALPAAGEISLGAPFEDFSAPTVQFGLIGIPPSGSRP